MTQGKAVVSVGVDIGTSYTKTAVVGSGGNLELLKNRDGVTNL